MRSVFLQLGPVSVYSYGLMLAIGILAALMAVRPRIAKVGISLDRLNNLVMMVIIAALVGARVTYVVLNRLSPAEIVESGHGGLSFFGGLAFGAMAVVILARFWRIRLLDLGDALVPGLALGEAITRIGCDIFGKESSAIWAVSHLGARVHPVQLYSFGLNLIAYLILKTMRPQRSGRVTAMYFVLLGTIRFALEFFRQGVAGQYWGFFASGLITLVGLYLLSRNNGNPSLLERAPLTAVDLSPLLLVSLFFVFGEQ